MICNLIRRCDKIGRLSTFPAKDPTQSISSINVLFDAQCSKREI